eukprot:TRINITY_DN52420_c0_g1_i1.p2 TRINITY_DN52420_c0_g1~~TRINITY_DN52420_c0_g1_i1.p2  ORF type:complete len:104 (+),score=5.02 TRINITY_DN52420_c0_g1_i1:988-1299(+)
MILHSFKFTVAPVPNAAPIQALRDGYPLSHPNGSPGSVSDWEGDPAATVLQRSMAELHSRGSLLHNKPTMPGVVPCPCPLNILQGKCSWGGFNGPKIDVYVWA